MMGYDSGRHVAVSASVLLHAGALLLASQLPPSIQTQQQPHGMPVQVTLQALAAPADRQATGVREPTDSSSNPLPSPPLRGRRELSSIDPALETGGQGMRSGGSLSHHVEPQPLQQNENQTNAIDTPSEVHAETATTAAADQASSGIFTTAPSALPTMMKYSNGQVRASLEEAFAAHFYYPMLARRKGWEGEVTLSLRVETDGRLTGIHVVSSSGYLILDSAAIDSLLRARTLPLPGGALGTGLDMVLPVQYRLLDAQV